MPSRGTALECRGFDAGTWTVSPIFLELTVRIPALACSSYREPGSRLGSQIEH
jgi:hypothetical protein